MALAITILRSGIASPATEGASWLRADAAQLQAVVGPTESVRVSGCPFEQPAGGPPSESEAGMTMLQSAVVVRLLSDKGPECIVPDACMTDVCDDLGIRVTRADDHSGSTPETDGRWVGSLRRIVAAKLTTWGMSGEPVQDAQLIVSELVTNALRYGEAAEIAFRLILTTKTITLAVNGGTSYRPRAVESDTDSENGRGLFIVAALASSWGIGDDGTTTWCTLRRPGTEVAR
ncbi:ATP-binding protein [Actinacidiphila sp. DG2A-62]|uniref:ATP-binding protein n=1 Tax=Actinacidiphila sp. DG2A-62 TaxID=3108821 RepID=UPI002DB82D39|nr:ATP-binding protein [Actinacidiphila sp. DG2A-62]MEC3995136.1 ATP-binding protein [Actinacidiphila sp. DG2A-62]